MKIKLTGYYESDENLFHSFINRYCGGKSHWKDLEIVNDQTYDRLIIFTSPHRESPEYNGNNAITFLTEPPNSPFERDHPTSEILEMFLPLPFLPEKILGSVETGGNGKKIIKNKVLSIITSDKNFFSGHQKRLEFTYYLDKIIADGLDIWGKQYGHQFFKLIKNYRGALNNKYEGLWKYQYHFACENSFVNNYFTEKIADPIIAECLCFYDGCKNLEKFIDDRAFIRIDVENHIECAEKIICSIENNDRQKRIKYIRQQKARLLTTLHPMNIIWLAVNEKDVLKECMLS